jgi:hypothetical protein
MAISPGSPAISPILTSPILTNTNASSTVENWSVMQTHAILLIGNKYCEGKMKSRLFCRNK